MVLDGRGRGRCGAGGRGLAGFKDGDVEAPQGRPLHRADADARSAHPRQAQFLKGKIKPAGRQLSRARGAASPRSALGVSDARTGARRRG